MTFLARRLSAVFRPTHPQNPYTQNRILTFLQPTTLPHHFHLLLSKSLSTQSPSFILRSTSSGPGLVQITSTVPSTNIPNRPFSFSQHTTRVSPRVPRSPMTQPVLILEISLVRVLFIRPRLIITRPHTTTGPCVLSNNPPTSTSKISVIKMARQAEAYPTSVSTLT